MRTKHILAAGVAIALTLAVLVFKYLELILKALGGGSF